MNQTEKWLERSESILYRLDDFSYATRKQLQVAEALGGDRNAHRVLFRMESDKAISSVRTEQKVYYLSSRGKEQIGSNQGELKRSWMTHTLMRNDMYIALGMPDTWQKEVPITFDGEKNYLIPDAMYNVGNKLHFIEIDNRQAIRENYNKIERYAKLFKAMFRQYKEHPELIWYTLSDMRRDKLKKACTDVGVKHIIY